MQTHSDTHSYIMISINCQPFFLESSCGKDSGLQMGKKYGGP